VIRAVYFLGRFVQLLAMSLLLMSMMTAGPMGPSPRIFVIAIAAFTVGWAVVKFTRSRMG
jgi:hypothetical protein